MTITVLIADDQALVRAGFRMILEAETDFEVVSEAANGAEALAAARRLKPDVVLMDVRMPELDGIEATRRFLSASRPGTKVVMLTTSTWTNTSMTPYGPEPVGFCSKTYHPSSW